MAIEINVGGGAVSDSLILGASYPLSLGFGDLFDTEGSRFARNTIIVTDDNDLDPILQAQKTYVPSGGALTFLQSMGTVVAKSDGEVVIFVSGSTTSYKSVNNGEAFTQNSAMPASCNADKRDSAAYSPTTGTLIVTEATFASTNVLRSLDGLTFASVNVSAGGLPGSVFCDANGTWYCGGSADIYTSVNDGVSWTPSGQSIINVFTFTEANNGRIIASKPGNEIWYSDNSGASWTQATAPSTGLVEAVSYLGNDTLIAVGSSAGSNKISTDNGANWSVYNALNAFGDGSGISKSIWSDGSGRAIIGVRDSNYDGTKDRIVILETKDSGSTLSQTSSVDAGSVFSGFAQGQNMRLFGSSTSYNAADFPVTYSYFDQGYRGGVGDSTTDNWATLIKKNV